LHKQLWTVLVSSFKMPIWQYAMMKEVLNPSIPYCVTFCVQHQISLKKVVIFLFAKTRIYGLLTFPHKSILNFSYAAKVYLMLVFPCMWYPSMFWVSQQIWSEKLKTENRDQLALCVHGLNVNHVNYLQKCLSKSWVILFLYICH
jgi:hypothetical protein